MIQHIQQPTHTGGTLAISGSSPGASPGPARLNRAAHRLAGGRRRGLGNCRSGAVAVEFVLASVPLMLLIFGFIATSAVFNTWSSMQTNVQYAARMMSTGTASRNSSGAISSTNTNASGSCTGTFTTTQVEYYACTGLPTWSTFTVSSTENCAVPSVTVSLSASATSAAIADIENFFSGKTIIAQAVMMKEGSCP